MCREREGDKLRILWTKYESKLKKKSVFEVEVAKKFVQLRL